MKSSPLYNKLQHYLVEHVMMYVHEYSYINMCKLNKNRMKKGMRNIVIFVFITIFNIHSNKLGKNPYFL